MRLTATTFEFNGCYARLDTNGEFVAGGPAIERRWKLDEAGRLYASSLLDKASGKEWLRETRAESAPSPPSPAGEGSYPVRIVQVSEGTDSAIALVVDLISGEPDAETVFRFTISPDSAAITIRLIVSPKPEPVTKSSEAPANDAAPTGIETADAARAAAASSAVAANDLQEALSLAPLHLRLVQVNFKDRTDHHNELVHESEWLLLNPEATLRLQGCLFILEDTLAGDGLIFLKVAPLPYARPVQSDYDFMAEAAARRFTLSGHGIAPDDPGSGYAWATIVYNGGTAGRIAALQDYQRSVRPYVPGRDGIFLSNTWGDRSRDGRVTHDFLANEIVAAERLGVDAVQIDDGWQKGKTSNSVVAGGVWEGFYAAENDFWQAHPERFPVGLAPMIEHARERGMRFGLWFAPDSSGDFANWEADSARLLELHRSFGVDYFKIDGVKLRTKTGERNLYAFFRRILEESEGRVVFDTDVTAETRPGYFGMLRTGPLFVENRYTDFRRWWPHSTLRNLWRLAQYVDPVRLRMEWLNHERNTEKYGDDTLAPATYRPDYLFATVMFSSPLGWFEVSNLPESYFTEAAPLIAVWKKHREAIQTGTILPIGDAPDGVAWTGFVSVARDRHSAYVLIFRELNSQDTQTFALPLLSPSSRLKVETLGGEGRATYAGGSLIVTISATKRFFFAKLSPAATPES